ncbi:MAG: cytosolic protein [Fimbriimonadales bacterium]
MRDDFDAWWKLFLSRFLQEFLALVAPELWAMIDWERGVQLLDKELLSPRLRGRGRRLYVDCLFKVYLKSGEAQILLIHIEVQARLQQIFPERMFRYFARLYVEYGLPIVSIAVLADANPRWRPTHFEYALGGTRLEFEFLTIKLTDFDPTALEQTDNPAALLLLAFLRARETANDMQIRFEVRKQLAILARERGYNDEQLARFDELLEGIMQLPESFERLYEESLEAYKREQGRPFISAAERIGLRDGLLQGLEQGLQQGLEQVLRIKFGSVPTEVHDALRKITDIETLQRLYDHAFHAATLEAFQQSLQAYLPNRSEATPDAGDNE